MADPTLPILPITAGAPVPDKVHAKGSADHGARTIAHGIGRQAGRASEPRRRLAGMQTAPASTPAPLAAAA
ncbi:hypothetical protein DOO78_02740 [Roseicella frigidaeris]|uniref:Uncharacterized protein n=1 Tax=Roseicella frigidaeris TaxID=2230885 RepID=A0A327MEP6_9PROT|nr:hypothetical protein DOO78_02740 [Roseicella frigidaeris]